MQLKIILKFFLFNYFLISVKSMDINENSDELEIFKHIFSKLNNIIDGKDYVQKELGEIKSRTQHLEEGLSKKCTGSTNSIVNKNEISTCDNLQVVAPSSAQSSDNYCFGNNWIVIQRRLDGSENFYREWNDYKNGFGNKSHEFFAGLETIHKLTNENPHELLIVMEDFENSKRYAKYHQFEIGSEEEGYVLKTLGNYSGNAGDSLTYHKNAQFSTKGRDNDQHTDFNCAEKFESAWWFKACFESNLNGCYADVNSREPKRAVACGIHWKTFRGQWYSLKSVEIMIRPK